jgi:hypothetical protein
MARRALTAVFAVSVALMLSAGVAHADPEFHITESSARPGDTLHFTISDADSGSSYAIDVAGRPVAQGSVPRSERVSGTFAMPDLGETDSKATVTAKIVERRSTRIRTDSVQYIAPPVVVPTPAPAPAPEPEPEPAPAPAPAVVSPPPSAPQAAPAADPPHALAQPVHKDRASRKRRAHRPRAERGPQRTAAVEHKRRSRRSKAKRKRAKHRKARTAPLFDGVPESGNRSDDGGGASAKSIGPRGVPAAAVGEVAGGGGFTAATLVPIGLGLGAVLLGATALFRRRQLRSGRER